VDASPDFIKPMLKHRQLHDPDYSIFRGFRGAPDDVILDVGANWGYSVGSIWASGSDCRIVSFEPWLPYRPCLQRIADLCPKRFEFRMVGLGNAPSMRKFAVPMVNDVAVVALATASPTPHLGSIAENLRMQVQQWMPTVQDVVVTVHEFEARVDRLDDLLREDKLLGEDARIAAIKIDVEGLEAEVVEGALETLVRYRPLVLVEAGNRSPGITELFASIGFSYAERQGDRLRPAHEVSRLQNGYFVHPEKIGTYASAGIFSDA
jgi:FkbM family methyltransferase